MGYEIPDAVLQQYPNDHPAKKLNYVFNMNVSTRSIAGWDVFCDCISSALALCAMVGVNAKSSFVVY